MRKNAQVFTIIFVIIVFYFSITVCAGEYHLLGDVDGDREVTILDATAIQKYLAKLIDDPNGTIRRFGDVDGNGLSILDATAIQNHLVGYPVDYLIGELIEDETPTVTPTEPPTERPTVIPTEAPIFAPTEAPTTASTSVTIGEATFDISEIPDELVISNGEDSIVDLLLYQSGTVVPEDFYIEVNNGVYDNKVDYTDEKFKENYNKTVKGKSALGYKNKKRLYNPPEKWAVFKNVHEPIIDRDTFELVQKVIKKNKRRHPKPENGEKSIFSDLLCCADCGSKLWHHTNSGNKDIRFFSCSNYKRDTRGSCETRHYIRADAIEEVVKLELSRLAEYLVYHEDEFAELLAEKTNADMLKEEKHLEGELARMTIRSQTVADLFVKIYEDNATGKLTDEMFMQLSQKYELERMELKDKIMGYKERIAKLHEMEQNKDDFIKAVRKFMEMRMLTAPLLRELIDHIDVYEKEGNKKHYTQRIMIYYRFVGYIEIPMEPDYENYIADTRQGVEVEYIPTDMFPAQHGKSA